MLIDEIKSIKSSKRDLKNFGLTVGSAAGILGVVLSWSGKEYGRYFLYAAVGFLLAGMAFPIALKPVQRLWMRAAVILGWFMTRIIIAILFYAVLTPTGVVARLFGKEFLDMRIDKSRKSYWNYRDIKKPEKGDYERQF
jgi:hypothetical protein